MHHHIYLARKAVPQGYIIVQVFKFLGFYLTSDQDEVPQSIGMYF